MTACVIGVDVGGTNTDAVVLSGESMGESTKRRPIGSAKVTTSRDVTTGVTNAVIAALQDCRNSQGIDINAIKISQVNIGTTHFVNAVIQKRDLHKVSILRLCGTSSRALPPYSDFPTDLSEVIQSECFMLEGGYQFDGETEISLVHEDEVQRCVTSLKADGIRNIVVSGVFSPVNHNQEEHVESLLETLYPEASVTLSHMIGQNGLLERENASVLNESLKPLCAVTLKAFRVALQNLGLECPFYLTQNDGTIISVEDTLKMPVHTFASGPTNSMRGAAFLSNVENATIIDIGGTTTDVGLIEKGFPREASAHVKIAGARTNFRMPDVKSIGLGGGSIVKKDDNDKVHVGPQSVGFRLQEEGRVFRGADGTLTATDIAVASGLADLGDKKHVENVPASLVTEAVNEIHRKAEQAIDEVKLTADPATVVLVGGGSILVDVDRGLVGCDKIIKPPFYGVANAVGAALSQVSGTYDQIVDLTRISREEAKEKAKQYALEAAIANRADPNTLKIVDESDVKLAYLPGNASRFRARAVGDLKVNTDSSKVAVIDLDKLQKPVEAEADVGELEQVARDVAAVLDIQQTPVHIDELTGEWHLSLWDVECIAIGAGILGSGGGGNPNLGRLRCRRALREGKKIRVISPKRINETMNECDLIYGGPAFMGAPAVMIEKVLNGSESVRAAEGITELIKLGGYQAGQLQDTEGVEILEEGSLRYINDYKPVLPSGWNEGNKKMNVAGLMSAEIGGLNCMEPLVLGAELDIPVVDADGMGRAFPELQMYSPFIYGLSPCPSIITDDKGQRGVVLQVESPKQLENHFREICIQMGCSAGIVLGTLTGQELLDTTIHHSLSRVWQVGNAVMQARVRHENPINAVLQCQNGQLICQGKICDVRRETREGFDRGFLRVEGTNECVGQLIEVDFQNENLIAKKLLPQGQSEMLVCTPDLICIMDSDSGEPIPTEELRYGLRVAVIGVASAAKMKTAQALKVVGPAAFGYDVKYQPIDEPQDTEPIPLQ